MGNCLNPNEQLNIDGFLASTNGMFRLLLQRDGNLVLYRMADQQPLWSAGTAGLPSQCALMQADGNFVVYGPAGALWQSGTAGRTGAGLLMQDDGNLVIYFGQAPIWATNTY